MTATHYCSDCGNHCETSRTLMHEYEDCKEWLADHHTDVWQEWKKKVEEQYQRPRKETQ